jgi:hypothetical protein
VTAYHVRLEEAAVLFSALGFPPPADPDAPEVGERAAELLRILGGDPE